MRHGRLRRCLRNTIICSRHASAAFHDIYYARCEAPLLSCAITTARAAKARAVIFTLPLRVAEDYVFAPAIRTVPWYRIARRRQESRQKDIRRRHAAVIRRQRFSRLLFTAGRLPLVLRRYAKEVYAAQHYDVTTRSTIAR